MLTYECEYQKTHPDYVPFSIPDDEYDGQDAGSPAYVARSYLAATGASLGCWGVIIGGVMALVGAPAASTVAGCGIVLAAGSTAYLIAREAAGRKRK